MGLAESEDMATVAFADVVAALRSLGGVAHTDIITGRIVQAKRLTPRHKPVMQSQVRRLLAEQEAITAAGVERVFGAHSNRWRLS